MSQENRKSASESHGNQQLSSNKPNSKEENEKTQVYATKPPLRSASNKDFSAWAEYLGEETDHEFINWKKEMVGEGQKQSRR